MFSTSLKIYLSTKLLLGVLQKKNFAFASYKNRRFLSLPFGRQLPAK